MSGRHRPSRLFRSRAVRTPVLVIAALALIGTGAIILRSVAADADGCSSAGIRLTVAADPAIAPAISEIGAAWTATRPAVGSDCIRVDVQSKPSHELANELGTWAGGLVDVAAKPAPTPSDADIPIVWIPDSSLWLGRIRAVDREMFTPDAKSVASSPVVLALPEAHARTLEAEVAQGVDTAMLGRLVFNPQGPKLKLGLVEPRRDTAGMVGAMVLADAVVASEADLPKLVQVYRTLGARTDDIAAMWTAMGSEPALGAPMSEQAVLAHNAGGAATPVAAIRLADVPTLDFPYGIRQHQPPAVAQAAAAFRAALAGDQYRPVLARHGLRAPDGVAAPGFPTGHGVTTTTVHVQALTDMGKVRSAMTVWVAARTPSRIVAMVDATSSMGDLLNGGPKTRIQVMREAAISGLGLFTPESLVGLWAFAGPVQRNLVPLDALGPALSAQRTKLTSAVAGATTMPTDECPLFAAIIAGYKELLNNYDPALSNTLVVFTDSKDSSGVSIRQVQRELEVLADVTRPIRVILLGIGPDIDKAQLDTIAATTGGKAFQVNSAEQMASIFLQALLT